MGPQEKEILEEAKKRKEQGRYFKASRSTPRDSLERCVDKGWLENVDIGEFYITDLGEKELEERREDDPGQQGLGDFS